MFGLRTTHLLPAAVATLALALTGCGAHDDTGSATDPATSQAPASSAEPGSTLALTADGSAAGKCAVPNAQTLGAFDTAFAGTVTALDGGTVTLAVDQWYAGDEASTVTVAAPSQDLQDLLMAVDFQQGTSYLVSATDGRVTLCGYTAEANADLQAIYDEAFAQ